MSTLSVLYDHPGPKAKRRNLIYSALFLIVLVAGVWVVIDTLADKGQLAGEKWQPFLEGSTWTTYLLPGLIETVKAAAVSVLIALPVGALLGIARLSDHAWVRWIAGFVVELFRAIPVLILMVFAFTFFRAITGEPSAFAGVVIALVLYNGSVLAEVFRSGIQALPKGQTEASQAIGLSKSQMMRSVLLPQAFTSMLPAIVSQLVVILKDTALGGIFLAFSDLRRMASTGASALGNTVPMYIVIAAMYILLNLSLTTLAGYLENRSRRKLGRRPATDDGAATAEAGVLPGSTVDPANVPGAGAGAETPDGSRPSTPPGDRQ